MVSKGIYIAHFFAQSRAVKILLILIGLFFCAPVISYAQEGGKKSKLEKIIRRKAAARNKAQSGNRGSGPRRSSANYARPNPFAGKKRSSEAAAAKAAGRRPGALSSMSATRRGEKAYKGNAGGRNFRSFSSARNRIEPRRDPYMGRPKGGEARAAKSASKYRTQTRTASGGGGGGGQKKRITPRTRSVSAQRRPVRSSSPVRSSTRPAERVAKRKTTSPRSISSVVKINRARNPYAFRDKKKWESAHPKDITGRRVRPNTPTRSTETRNVMSVNPYAKRKSSLGDKPYSGKAGKAGVRTATRSSERAWKGDISGRKLRAKNQSSTRPPQKAKPTFNPYFSRRKGGDQPYSGKMTPKGSRTASRSGESQPGKALQSRKLSVSGVGRGAQKPPRSVSARGRSKGGDQPYLGKMTPKGSRTASRSGESKPGKALQSRKLSVSGVGKGAQQRPQFSPYAKRKGGDQPYSGKLASKGNRSVTGQNLGNQTRLQFSPYGKRKGGDQPYMGRLAKGKTRSVSRGPSDLVKKSSFTGSKSLSITGKNSGKWKELPQKPQSKTGKMAGAFSGNTKRQKPLKGGGTVARNSWNNDEKPLTQWSPPRAAQHATLFQGNVKAKKPLKGGGTVARNSWNNDEEPLKKEAISPQIHYAVRFQGTTKKKDLTKMNDDYKGYEGDIKVKNGKGKGHHPSFYHLTYKTRNSVAEKEKPVSFKLMWSKLFRSNNPPQRKPDKLEFDKGEIGMWHD